MPPPPRRNHVNEWVQQLLRLQEQTLGVQTVMAWVLAVEVLLLFVSLTVVSAVWYVTRDTQRGVHKLDEIAAEGFRRLGYYLFQKLGPLGTK
jgi:hypothetical protein